MVEKDKKTYKEKNGTTRLGDFLRSIGKSNILEKVIGTAGEIASGDVLGAITTLLGGTNELTPEQRDYALKMAELDFREQEEISKRWDSDMMSDSWMSKNIRPYTLAILTFFLLFIILLDSSIENFNVSVEWIKILSTLLGLVYGAYFGSRGLEKIMDKIAQIKK